MKKYNISKNNIYSSKEKAPVTLINYLFMNTSTNEKCIIFKLKNDFNHTLTSLTFEISEFTKNDQLIKKQVLTYNDINIDSNEEFTPYRKAIVDRNCDHIKFMVGTAVFDNLIWEEEKWYFKQTSKNEKYSKEQSDVIKYEGQFYDTKKKTLKLKSHLIFTILLFAIFACLVFINVQSTHKKIYETPIEEQYMWHYNNDKDIVIDRYIGYNNNVVIPYMINNKPVVSIGPNVFSDKNIKSINIKSPIIDIKYNAFSNLKKLESFKCRDIDVIGKNAFIGCENLKSFSCGMINEIHTSAFKNCVKLNSFRSGDIKIIRSGAFYQCSMLEIFDTGTINYIDSYAFSDCNNLKYLSLNVETITENAFYNCLNLKDIDVSNTIVERNSFYGSIHVETFAFKDTGCSSIGQIFGTSNHFLANSLKEVKTGMTNITEHFFGGLTSLEKIRLYDEYVKIAYGAFKTCNLKNYIYTELYEKYEGTIISVKKGLTSFTFTKDITKVLPNAFYGCMSTISKIYHNNQDLVLSRDVLKQLEGINEVYISEGCEIEAGSLNHIESFNYIKMPCFGTKLNNYIKSDAIVEKLELIGDNRIPAKYFSNLNDIQEIDISESINTCSNYAFTGLTNLQKLTMAPYNSLKILGVPNSINELIIKAKKITKIPKDFCKDYYHLTNIKVEDGIKEINSNFISNCPNVSNLIIPDSVALIRNPLIGTNCSNLKNIQVPFIGETKDVPRDYVKFNLSAKNTINLFITNNTSVSRTMFTEELPNLKTLYFNKFMTGKYEGALAGLINLETLKIYQASITHLGQLFKYNDLHEDSYYVPISLTTVIFEEYYNTPSVKDCEFIENLFYLDCNKIDSSSIVGVRNLKNFYANDSHNWIYGRIRNGDYRNRVNIILKDYSSEGSNSYYQVIDNIDNKHFKYFITYKGEVYSYNSLIINNKEEIAMLLGLDNTNFTVRHKYENIDVFPFIDPKNVEIEVVLY